MYNTFIHIFNVPHNETNEQCHVYLYASILLYVFQNFAQSRNAINVLNKMYVIWVEVLCNKRLLIEYLMSVVLNKGLSNQLI